MLRQGLILTSNREYAQAMRLGLLGLGDVRTRVDVELDSLRAMQLVPQQYDLILLDAMLDAMDGLQLLLLMKQQAPGGKFVLVTDAPDETSRAQAYQNGADLFLPRPCTPEAIQKVLEEVRKLLLGGGDQPLQDDQDGPLVAIADIVQTRCLSGDSLLLLVRSQRESGDIFIFRGEVYHAQYPGKGGAAAFHDMIHWDDGLVRIKALPLTHVPPRTIETPYRQLLDQVENSAALNPDMRPPSGELLVVSGETLSQEAVSSVVQEAPPLKETAPVPTPDIAPKPERPAAGETPLPMVNCHWKINLMGELVEGSQVAEPDRCAFITYFLYRKLADVAVALEVDYFSQMTLLGPHLQQVLVADNIGVQHAVFDTSRTNEEIRTQYVKWCCEQSI